MTLGHTFSYIVSLPVSEKVSGVAILASNLEKVGKFDDGVVRVPGILVFGTCSNCTDESLTAPDGHDAFAADLPCSRGSALANTPPKIVCKASINTLGQF